MKYMFQKSLCGKKNHEVKITGLMRKTLLVAHFFLKKIGTYQKLQDSFAYDKWLRNTYLVNVELYL